jgi:BioD-like phosphotransacetylase family protein
MKKIKSVFISSIGQNVGKTTVSLGLYQVFQERGLKPAFLKPVGQQTVSVGQLDVDKDSYLMGEVYRCRDRLKEMSPVTIGPGYTEKYISNPQQELLRDRILSSFTSLIRGKNSIIIEGTGHAGVGSVIDLSNADVAQILGSKVIIVSEGGIGRSIDEIMLNQTLFAAKQVEVVGVILNKVIPSKMERIQKVVAAGLKRKGLQLLGAIPFDPLLRDPMVGQIMHFLKMKVLCGEEYLFRRVENTIVAAMEPYNMVNYLTKGTLVLTSGDRVDNILVAVSTHLVKRGSKDQIAGIILTGGLMPNDKIIELLQQSRIPVLLSEEDTYTVAREIDHLVCKIQKTDKNKIKEARQMVKKYVDVNALIEKL